MGVEYKHFLIPENPSFVPEKDVIKKIDDVLYKWNLKTGIPKVYDLTNGINAVVDEALDSLRFEHGMAVEYPSIDGKPAAAVMGISYFYDDVIDEDRYIQGITFIVGVDYRIHPSSEELSMTVAKPPFEGATAIEPYCEMDEFLHYGLHGEAYNCSITTTAPEVDVWVANMRRIIGEQNFYGYWRTALIIECGKDLPLLRDETLYKIPNKEFISDFENALGSKVIEIGEIY